MSNRIYSAFFVLTAVQSAIYLSISATATVSALLYFATLSLSADGLLLLIWYRLVNVSFQVDPDQLVEVWNYTIFTELLSMLGFYVDFFLRPKETYIFHFGLLLLFVSIFAKLILKMSVCLENMDRLEKEMRSIEEKIRSSDKEIQSLS